MLPAGVMLLAAQTARPFAVLVRHERPLYSVLLLGAAMGALLVLAARAWMGARVSSSSPAPAAPRAERVPAAPKPARSWSRKATARVGTQARTLAERGASGAEIARRLGVSQDAVAFALGRSGAGRKQSAA